MDDGKGVNIRAFEKESHTCFMNRNDEKATHILRMEVYRHLSCFAMGYDLGMCNICTGEEICLLLRVQRKYKKLHT